MADYQKQIEDEYQRSLGRKPTDAELQSDLENANKYGTAGSLLGDIAKRGSNAPNQQQNETPQYGSTSAQSGYKQSGNLPMEAVDPQTKQRSDSIWQLLYSKATADPNVSASDPIIRAQTDAYGAQQERSQRNYLADLAEQRGLYGQNMDAERRLAAEHAGQATGAFQAELMGRELTARRQEIQAALAQAGSMISDQEKNELMQALAVLDNEIKKRGLDIQASGQSQNYDARLREIGLSDWDRTNYWDAVRSGLLD